MTVNNNPSGVNLLYDQAIGRVKSQQYITRGLMFALDGIESVDGDTWYDTSGNGVNYTLVNCQRSGRGIAFDGSTSYAYNTDNQYVALSTGTIEVAVKFDTSLLSETEIAECIFSPAPAPAGREDVIGCALMYSNPHLTTYWYTACDFRSSDRYRFRAVANTPAINDGVMLFGARPRGISEGRAICSFNGVSGSTSSSVMASVPLISQIENLSSIGARATVDDDETVYTNFFKGIIYSVRLYNVQLTIDEIKHNQHVDNLRFNLGLNI